jgi:hypothetical protein
MRALVRALGALWLTVTLTFALACGSNRSSGFDDGGAGDGSGGKLDARVDSGADGMTIHLFEASDSEAAACVGLQCQITCASTAISGKVYDPAGLIGLYNVYVYVPNAPLAPIPTGPVCTACQAPASGAPIVSATTAADGTFTITGAPDGANIPVVLQLGKWRRHLTIPKVTACANNAPVDGFFRLPRKQGEGSPDDNIPLIAYTTGCDGAECFFNTRVGIDISEFTDPTGTGRVHIYKGSDDGQSFPGGAGTAMTLWSSPGEMMKYDIIFDACECSPLDRGGAGSTDIGYMNFLNYLDMGGRAFTTHYFYNFFASPAECGGGFGFCDGQGALPTIGTWEAPNPGVAFAPAGNCPKDPTIPANAGGPGSCMSIDTTIPKGMSFADWYSYNNPMLLVGGGEAHGYLGLMDLREDMGTLDPALVAAGTATPWLYAGNLSGVYNSYYLSVNTPVGTDATTQCGRAVFSDVHVAGSGGGLGTGETVPAGAFPSYCAMNPNAANHAPDELALEFLFFDLSSCVQDDKMPPPPPPPVK